MRESRRLLHELLVESGPLRLTAVVDIGANPIDGDPPYAELLGAGLCSVTGFEPQADALAALRARQGPHELYLPYIIGGGGPGLLHVARASGMTSLLEPDPAALKLFNGFPEWGAIDQRLPVETVRLDDVHEIEHLDLLKIDVQGGELEVFRGGQQRLASAVAVHSEVSFIPLYRSQPTIGDVDQELRRQGFVPHAMVALKRWPIAPVIYDGDFRKPMHQVLEADMVYVRSLAAPEQLSVEQLQHLAVIAHFVYGSSDLVHHCLAELVRRDAVRATGPAEYLASLSAG